MRTSIATRTTIDTPVLCSEARRGRTITAFVRAAEGAVREDGGQAVVLGCTGTSSLVAATRKRLAAKGLDVPIVEPRRAAVYTAAACTLGGIAHSKEAFMPRRAKRRAVDFPT